MAILDTLALSTTQKIKHQSPAIRRRIKLVNKLHEQLLLAQSEQEGKTYEIPVFKKYKDEETGITKSVESTRKIRRWWFYADNGKVMMQVKYGMKVIELAKGKSTIEIGKVEKLPSTIEVLKKAVLEGELDNQISLSLNKHK